jgi:hypothetical protein
MITARPWKPLLGQQEFPIMEAESEAEKQSLVSRAHQASTVSLAGSFNSRKEGSTHE